VINGKEQPTKVDR